jgi:hypothetical protein
VLNGTYYYELTIVDMPAGSHARFGWAQSSCELNAFNVVTASTGVIN